MKIAVETIGCKLNQAETEALARRLIEAGHCLVATVEEADIYIINTCTVTANADARSRRLLRQAHRKNGKASLVVTGCYAQRIPEELKKLEGVKLVVGNEEKSSLPFLLEEISCADGICPLLEAGGSSDESLWRTRSFIKIQDGCSKFCAYCIVPIVRGSEKSRPADEIIAEVDERISCGVEEVVLTGTEIGAYDYHNLDLKGLLELILSETDISRIRLSSLQPKEITSELIGLWRDSRLCSHFHLSLQSGSDSVLKRMNRNYSATEYEKAVLLIREMVPDAAVTTDIIAGFPGESEAEFEESLAFCRGIGFARIHVFAYSKRRGTMAASAPGQINETVKKQRSQKLLAFAEECGIHFRQRFTGRTIPVLWEQEFDDIWSGYTGNYIRVFTRSDADLNNRLLAVTLGGLCGDGLWGEVA